MRQETTEFWDGSDISWTICKQSAPQSRQMTTPTPHHSIFYRPDALPDSLPTVSKHWRHIWYELFLNFHMAVKSPIYLILVHPCNLNLYPFDLKTSSVVTGGGQMGATAPAPNRHQTRLWDSWKSDEQKGGVVGCRGVTLEVNGNGNSCVLHAVDHKYNI